MKFIFGFLVIVFLPLASIAGDKFYLSFAKVVVQEGKGDFFEAQVKKVLAPTREEPGCISYEAFRLQKDGKPSNEFEFREKWKEEQDLQDHLKSPHMSDFMKAIGMDTPQSILAQPMILEGGYVTEVE